jgi:hypothetical protein
MELTKTGRSCCYAGGRAASNSVCDQGTLSETHHGDDEEGGIRDPCYR